MKIGFIGFGEVGYEMSHGLLKDGIEEIYAFDPLYKEAYVRDRANEIGVKLVSSPEQILQKGVKVLFVAVPAQHAYSAWEAIYKYFNENTLYIDVSTASASIKNSIYEKLMNKTKLFVDAALMGPLPVYKHRVPISASGNGVELFMELMSNYNMNIQNVGKYPGDATNIKLTRSIFMKGISALLFEVLELSQQLNVEEQVLSSIVKTMNDQSFEQTVNRLITGTVVHSERRVKEMENVIKLEEENYKNPLMSIATKEKLKQLTELGLKSKFDNKTPDDWRLVIKNINMGGIGE